MTSTSSTPSHQSGHAGCSQQAPTARRLAGVRASVLRCHVLAATWAVASATRSSRPPISTTR